VEPGYLNSTAIFSSSVCCRRPSAANFAFTMGTLSPRFAMPLAFAGLLLYRHGCRARGAAPALLVGDCCMR